MGPLELTALLSPAHTHIAIARVVAISSVHINSETAEMQIPRTGHESGRCRAGTDSGRRVVMPQRPGDIPWVAECSMANRMSRPIRCYYLIFPPVFAMTRATRPQAVTQGGFLDSCFSCFSGLSLLASFLLGLALLFITRWASILRFCMPLSPVYAYHTEPSGQAYHDYYHSPQPAPLRQ